MQAMEQGTVMECVYCNIIYPELKGCCPECNNSGPSFTPARMMDRESSLQEVLQDLFYLADGEREYQSKHTREQALEYRNWIKGIIKAIRLYNFDLEAALIQHMKNIDCEFSIDPKNPKE